MTYDHQQNNVDGIMISIVLSESNPVIQTNERDPLTLTLHSHVVNLPKELQKKYISLYFNIKIKFSHVFVLGNKMSSVHTNKSCHPPENCNSHSGLMLLLSYIFLQNIHKCVEVDNTPPLVSWKLLTKKERDKIPVCPFIRYLHQKLMSILV